MRKFLTYALFLGAAIAIAGVAGADQNPGTGAAIHCEWQGNCGTLTITGAPGQAYQVFDAEGQPLAMGMLEDGQATLPVGFTTTGPDGAVLHVQVGDEMLTGVDPNWEWD